MKDLRILRTRRCAAFGVAFALGVVSGCTLMPGAERGDTAAATARATGTDARTAATATQAGVTPTGVGADNAGFLPSMAAIDPWAQTMPLADITPPAPIETAPIEPAVAGPADLLDRLRREFRLPGADVASVQRELDWFASHPEYLDRVFGRASSYLHFIVAAIEERGMPLDLALLPVVESAFDPFAYSHGRASGLWQIIPGTGRRLGLKQNWWFDGRRDIPESTRAALDYLQALHDQFNGDWLLAVAGYNSGEGNVARAIRKAEAAGRPIDFWSIRGDLPVETRTYVPRLIAIRDLVADPESFAVTLPEIADEPVFAAVDTGSQIDLSLAAELAGIDIDTLYAFNPGVNRWATDPEGPHRLLLPLAAAATLEKALVGLGENERVRWTRHRIAQGETLSEIALEYDTTIDALRDINDIRGNSIRAGSFLMIPHAAASASIYSQSLDARTGRTQNRERDGNRIVHVVRSGDSFWSIAQRYDVGVRELAAWNAMAPGDTLPIGRELVVWADAAESVVAFTRVAAPLQQVRRVDYVVRRGDSLASIARRFRVTVAKLVEWNALDPKRYLQPGQRLVMHVDVTEQSS